MRPFARLAGRRKSCAILVTFFRQCALSITRWRRSGACAALAARPGVSWPSASKDLLCAFRKPRRSQKSYRRRRSRHRRRGRGPEHRRPRQLAGAAARTKESKASARAVEHLLGLSSEATHESVGELAASSWPSQSEVARGLAVDPGTVSRAVASARKRWLKTPAMTGLREDIAALLENQGGVMTGTELAEALLSSRGSVQSEPVRTSQAFAVLRSAVETERDRAAPAGSYGARSTAGRSCWRETSWPKTARLRLMASVSPITPRPSANART
jgi:hypothetical protein